MVLNKISCQLTQNKVIRCATFPSYSLQPMFRFEVVHRQCVSQTGSSKFEYLSDQTFLSTPPVYAVGLDEDDMNKPQVHLGVSYEKPVSHLGHRHICRSESLRYGGKVCLYLHRSGLLNIVP